MEVGVANFADADVRDLIALHQRQMYNASPPGTSFALDLSGLERPDVTVFDARQVGELLGSHIIPRPAEGLEKAFLA